MKLWWKSSSERRGAFFNIISLSERFIFNAWHGVIEPQINDCDQIQKDRRP